MSEAKWYSTWNPLNGEIVGNFSSEEEYADLNTPKGLRWVEGRYKSDENFVRDGVVIFYNIEQALIKSQIKLDSSWSNESFRWEDQRTLDQLKVQKWEEIKQARNSEAFPPTAKISFGVVQSDKLSVDAMIRSSIGDDESTVEWTLSDNTIVQITRGQLKEAVTSLVDQENRAHLKSQRLRQKILSASSFEKISLITWDSVE